MHVLVDGLVGFAATALVLAFFGVPLWVMILLGWAIGIAAAPFTRRVDERQLAERTSGEPPAPGTGT
jgi:type IV secretory pathway TrbD component